MGKIRVATLGDEAEKEQKRRAEARRQTKKSKKEKVEGVGLHGGERVAVVEGSDIKPEFKKLVEEVEAGEKSGEAGSGSARKVKKQKVKIRSKRYQDAAKLVDKNKLYSINEAVDLVKKTSLTKFDGTVELHINLNPASLGEKKEYRTNVTLPHGTGKEVRVAIADDKILSEIEAGKINFDILVAHPSLMPKLAKVARILGPKGLMPNPKTGTVSPDPERRAKELAKGEMNIKTEPGNPIIHMPIGKVSFESSQLKENIDAVINTIGTSKLAKLTLSATMGPGVKVQIS